MFPTYQTGTVSIGNGDTSLVGVDTIWLFPNVREGDHVSVDGAPAAIILSVDSETALTVPEWSGGAKSAVGYVIYHDSPLRYDGGNAMLDVSQLISYLREQGTMYAVEGDEPDPSIGEEGQFALKSNAAPWRFWLKTGGVWVEQAVPVGTTYRGAWSSVTAYVENDVVSYQGSAWIANAPSTNQTPPSLPTTSNAYWEIFSAKGDTGATGATGTSLLYGTGAPSNGTGNNGDFYIATDTKFLYGPKSGGVWPAGTSLLGPTGPQGNVGATGPAGVDGKTLRYGSGVPSIGMGADGDFYIDVSADVLYGPKAAGSWPSSTSLVGPQGSPGATGDGLDPDASGTLAERDAYDGAAQGFIYLRTDVVPFLLYVKASNTSADWSSGNPIGGSAPLGSMGPITGDIISSFSCGAIA